MGIKEMGIDKSKTGPLMPKWKEEVITESETHGGGYKRLGDSASKVEV